jgi:transcriptional regulator with XRE-family HTH domain
MTVSVRVRSLSALVERAMSQGSQRDLARRVGSSPTAINLLLQGKRSTVSLDLAARIEDALDVPRAGLSSALTTSNSSAPTPVRESVQHEQRR